MENSSRPGLCGDDLIVFPIVNANDNICKAPATHATDLQEIPRIERKKVSGGPARAIGPKGRKAGVGEVAQYKDAGVGACYRVI